MDKQKMISDVVSSPSEEMSLLYSALEFQNPFVVSFLDGSGGELLELYWELIDFYTKQKLENMKYKLEPTQLNVVIEKQEEKQGNIILPEKKTGFALGKIISKGELVPESIMVEDDCLFRIEQATEFDGKYIINCKAIVLK